MKLFLQRDLEPIRQDAYAQIDGAYEAACRDPVAAIHAAKAKLAESKDLRLQGEADARGMSLETLCILILVKNREWQDKVLQLDAERLALKETVRLADSEQQIRQTAEAQAFRGIIGSQ